MRLHGNGIGHQEKNVNPFDRGVDFAEHLFVQRGLCFVNAGRIDENDLAIGARDDALDAIASGLRLRGDDGDFLADEPVQQSRFACVRAANDGDESGAMIWFCGWRGHEFSPVRRCRATSFCGRGGSVRGRERRRFASCSTDFPVVCAK